MRRPMLRPCCWDLRAGWRGRDGRCQSRCCGRSRWRLRRERCGTARGRGSNGLCGRWRLSFAVCHDLQEDPSRLREVYIWQRVREVESGKFPVQKSRSPMDWNKRGLPNPTLAAWCLRGHDFCPKGLVSRGFHTRDSRSLPTLPTPPKHDFMQTK